MPTYSQVGPAAANHFIVLVEHQPLDFIRRVLPVLKRNAENGQADPSNYASMFDRAQTYDKKPQLYGMNFVCTPEGKLTPSPIQDPEHLDQRRAALGLLPMRIYAKLVVQNMPEDFCKKIAAGEKHAPQLTKSNAH